jgi:hypothetical protein
MKPAEIFLHIDIGGKETPERVDAIGDHWERRSSVRNDELEVWVVGDCR